MLAIGGIVLFLAAMALGIREALRVRPPAPPARPRRRYRDDQGWRP